MSDRLHQGIAATTDAQFRANRIATLAAVNLNTFWSIAVIVLAFGWWDLYVDPANAWSAFRVRILAAVIIIATGMFQKVPGNSRWMPLMAKIRLVTAVVASIVAALTLDRGYGFGVAGVVAIILTGPYIAIDTRDLAITNAIVLLALGAVMLWASLDTFDAVGTVVFVLLAALVSTLLARVLEASHRRAFALDLELQREARTDSLTGLNNRRAMQERALLELKRADRAATPVSVILCDIDHFKSINDRHGHEAGDAALRTVAAVLRSAVRSTDAIGRWGGEEFIVLLPDTEAPLAVEVAERMRATVASAAFDAIPAGATVSLGVSTCPRVDEVLVSWEALLTEADDNLYRAKSEGRNRVVAAPANQ